MILAHGQTILEDEIQLKDGSSNTFQYSALGFFQGNLNAYSEALSLMKSWIDPKLPAVDMFSGVGSIGLSLADENQDLSLVEIDQFNTKFAKLNSSIRSENTTKVITSSSEGALEYIISDINLILDPPRAGLHKDITAKICEIKPKNTIYLSCNPATQARDVKLLIEGGYRLQDGPIMFNFFPRTPHIESLIRLNLKNYA